MNCLDALIRGNFFESAKLVLESKYTGDSPQYQGKELSDAHSKVQSAIQYVRNQQDYLMNIFDAAQQMQKFQDTIHVISPSVRWTQSRNATYVELKFAHRFDAPACLDISDLSVDLVKNRTLLVNATCKQDKRFLKYQLDMDLSKEVFDFERDGELYKNYHALYLEKHKERRAKYLEDEALYNETSLIWYEKEKIYNQWNNAKTDWDFKENRDKVPEEYLNEDKTEFIKEQPEAPGGFPSKPAAVVENPLPLIVSTYNTTSVGRITFYLPKMETFDIWKRLDDKTSGKYRGSIQYWWEMSDQLQEKDEWVDPMEENQEDKEFEEEIKLKKEKRAAEKEEKEKNKKNKKKKKKGKKGKAAASDEEAVKDEL